MGDRDALAELVGTVLRCTRPTIPGGPTTTVKQTPHLTVIEVNDFPATEDLDPEIAAGVVDVVFMQVAFTPACDHDGPGLLTLIAAAEHGEYVDVTVDELRGAPTDYMRLGGWLGDQGIALRFMALCAHLGIGRIVTARDMLAEAMSIREHLDTEQAYAALDATSLMTPDLVREYGGRGMLWLQLHPVPVEERGMTYEPGQRVTVTGTVIASGRDPDGTLVVELAVDPERDDRTQEDLEAEFGVRGMEPSQ